jgi:hypothetical protein
MGWCLSIAGKKSVCAGLECEADDKIVFNVKAFPETEKAAFTVEDLPIEETSMSTRHTGCHAITVHVKGDHCILCWFLGNGDADVPNCCDQAEA